MEPFAIAYSVLLSLATVQLLAYIIYDVKNSKKKIFLNPYSLLIVVANIGFIFLCLGFLLESILGYEVVSVIWIYLGLPIAFTAYFYNLFLRSRIIIEDLKMLFFLNFVIRCMCVVSVVLLFGWLYIFWPFLSLYVEITIMFLGFLGLICDIYFCYLFYKHLSFSKPGKSINIITVSRFGMACTIFNLCSVMLHLTSLFLKKDTVGYLVTRFFTIALLQLTLLMITVMKIRLSILKKESSKPKAKTAHEKIQVIESIIGWSEDFSAIKVSPPSIEIKVENDLKQPPEIKLDADSSSSVNLKKTNNQEPQLEPKSLENSTFLTNGNIAETKVIDSNKEDKNDTLK